MAFIPLIKERNTFVRLKALTDKAGEIIKIHGDLFSVEEVTLGNHEFAIKPAFRIESLEKTNYIPYVGRRAYWTWLELPRDDRFDFTFVKGGEK